MTYRVDSSPLVSVRLRCNFRLLFLAFIPICPTRLIKGCSAKSICSVFTSMKPTHPGYTVYRGDPLPVVTLQQLSQQPPCVSCVFMWLLQILRHAETQRGDFFYKYLCSWGGERLARQQDVPVDDEWRRGKRLQFTGLQTSSSHGLRISRKKSVINRPLI